MSVYDDLEVFTGQEELNAWSSKPLVIGSLMRSDTVHKGVDQAYTGGYSVARVEHPGGDTAVSAMCGTAVTIVNYNNDGNRKVGYIQGVMDDGSYILSILGSGVIPLTASLSHYVTTYMESVANFKTHADETLEHMVIEPNIDNFYWQAYAPGVAYGNAGMSANIGVSPAYYLDSLAGSLYAPQWQNMDNTMKNYINHVIFLFGKIAGASIENMQGWSDIQLTNNENTTLTIGDNYSEYIFTPHDNMIYRNGYANIGGALNGIQTGEIINEGVALGGKTTDDIRDGVNPLTNEYEIAIRGQGTYAGYYCPFNLILTRNLDEAKNYLNTGELPSDAFLYPFDVENIPVNDSGESPDPSPVNPDEGDDVPNEEGEPEDNTDPTPTIEPNDSPLTLTNNNLYWISSTELKNFVNWFWTDATDIASAGDLWDKIRGLYENLAQAVLAVRYMPVRLEWIGSASSVPSIVVGQIEKQGAVLSLNKAVVNGQLVPSAVVSPIREIGTFEIPVRFNGGFANYSPYSTLSLWLPFHGFVDLDIDLLIGHTIAIKCVYDVISGTIQYFVFRGGYNGQIIHTCVAKMAVDIPLTLQTKTERDSATFQNVSNAVGSLVGAGASAVAGSPIGITMNMMNFTGMQAQGAGLTVKGTVGECGAFYQPSKCAVYIKRPNYNRPDIYGKRVGYPANTSKQLKSCKGFTQVYNPYIEFTHTVKPYKEEIDLIYEYLEKGVIL